MPDETATDDPVAALMAERGEELLNRLNADFEDSMLLVGRVLGGHPAATATVVRDVDRNGVDVTITDPDGAHAGRIEFDEPVTDAMALTGHLLGLVVRARADVGRGGPDDAPSAR